MKTNWSKHLTSAKMPLISFINQNEAFEKNSRRLLHTIGKIDD